MAEFQFKELEVEVPQVPDLGNTEKEILRGLAEPGGPLWKIMRRMRAYGEGLKEALATADLDDPAAIRAVKKIQATIAAVAWVEATFESALTPGPEQEEKTDERS